MEGGSRLEDEDSGTKKLKCLYVIRTISRGELYKRACESRGNC